MAYKVMACMVMGYIAMAHIATAYKFTACIVRGYPYAARHRARHQWHRRLGLVHRCPVLCATPGEGSVCWTFDEQL